MAREKSDYEKAMDENILEIEAGIGHCLSKGWTPEVLMGHPSLIYQLLTYLKVEADWTDKGGVFIALGDGEIPLRIIRSVDVTGTEIWVK